jgi:hypothetical protein
MEGWTTPTLRHVDSQWRIYSNGGAVFVLLWDAPEILVAACAGAAERLEELNCKPF